MKKITALLLSIVMAFSLVACGSKKLPSDPAELMKVANENMQKVKSMTAKANMNLSMTQGKENVDMSVDMNMDIIKKDDTMKAKVDATVNMGEAGGQQTMTMYMAPEGDNFYIYVGMLGQWMKMKYDIKSVLEAQKNAKDTDVLGSSAANFTVTDETDDNGNKVKVLSGKMSADTMKESLTKAFETAGTVEGVDETQMQQIKAIAESCLADVQMTYYVDEKSGQITHMSMDLSEIAKKAIESVSALAGDAVSGLSIENFDISMDCSNFDKVADFEVPQEALDGQEMDLTGAMTNPAGDATQTDDAATETEDTEK